MNAKDYRRFRRRATDRLKSLRAAVLAGDFDEQALPAYTSQNPVSRWVFWKRVAAVMRMLPTSPRPEVAIDFGSGLGLMLPALAARARKVIAVEVEPDKLLRGLRALDIFIPGLQIETSLASLLPEYACQAGIILAMDVLEHVEDPGKNLEDMTKLLKPDGLLVITGPTENLIYRFGRWISGFHGHYHRRSIYDIERVLSRYFDVVNRRALFSWTPIFIIVGAQPKPAKGELSDES